MSAAAACRWFPYLSSTLYFFQVYFLAKELFQTLVLLLSLTLQDSYPCQLCVKFYLAAGVGDWAICTLCKNNGSCKSIQYLINF
jgi:hypothetical protein